MLEFNGPVFCSFVRDLASHEYRLSLLAAMEGDKPPSGELRHLGAELLSLCDDVTTFFDLPATESRRTRALAADDSLSSASEMHHQFKVLRETFEDELKARLVFLIPSSRAKYFSEGNLFGVNVPAIFPRVTEDVDEAGKCLAAARYTASVFNLMRVMEAGVKEFGKLLGVKLADEKNWGNIIEQVQARLKLLPNTDATAAYTRVAVHLNLVRIAWRNPVMHPKATYTEEEATKVFGHCQTFMDSLAETMIEHPKPPRARRSRQSSKRGQSGQRP